MKRKVSQGFLLLSVLIGMSLGCPAFAQSQFQYEVTITNVTRGQVFTPIVVASHKDGFHLFSAGQPASVELEQIAEGGDTGPLETSLRGSPDVLEVADSGAPLPPGQSVTVMVNTRGQFDHLSVVSMLVPTNDAFFALNGVEGPKGKNTSVLYVPAYDAGTEANDELCTSIPGPPVLCNGEGFNASREGAEGYIHIHAGIHGIGDLVAAERDWRNPVARITIRRVR